MTGLEKYEGRRSGSHTLILEGQPISSAATNCHPGKASEKKATSSAHRGEVSRTRPRLCHPGKASEADVGLSRQTTLTVYTDGSVGHRSKATVVKCGDKAVSLKGL